MSTFKSPSQIAEKASLLVICRMFLSLFFKVIVALPIQTMQALVWPSPSASWSCYKAILPSQVWKAKAPEIHSCRSRSPKTDWRWQRTTKLGFCYKCVMHHAANAPYIPTIQYTASTLENTENDMNKFGLIAAAIAVAGLGFWQFPKLSATFDKSEMSLTKKRTVVVPETKLS